MKFGRLIGRTIVASSGTLGIGLSAKNFGSEIRLDPQSMFGAYVDNTILSEKYKAFNTKYEELRNKNIDVTMLTVCIKEIIALVNTHARELFDPNSNPQLSQDELNALVLLIKSVISQESIKDLNSSIIVALIDDPVCLLINLVNHPHISDKLQTLMHHSLSMCVKNGEGNLNKLLCGLRWFFLKTTKTNDLYRHGCFIQVVFNEYKIYIIENMGKIGVDGVIDSINNRIDIISGFIAEYINRITPQQSHITPNQDVAKVIVNLIINTAKSYSGNLDEINFTALINLCDAGVVGEILADIGVNLFCNYIKSNNIVLGKLVAILKICCRSEVDMIDMLIKNVITKCAEFDLSRADKGVLHRYRSVLCCMSYISSINIETGQINFINDEIAINNADLAVLVEQFTTQLKSVHADAVGGKLRQQICIVDALILELNQSQNGIERNWINQVRVCVDNCVAILQEYQQHPVDADSDLYNMTTNVLLSLIITILEKFDSTAILDTLTKLFNSPNFGIANSLDNSVINLLAHYIADGKQSVEVLSNIFNILGCGGDNGLVRCGVIIKGGFASYSAQLHRQIDNADNNYPISIIKCGVLDRVKSIVNLYNDISLPLSSDDIQVWHNLIEIIFVALSRVDINQQNVNDYIGSICELINKLPGIFLDSKYLPVDLICKIIELIKHAVYNCEDYQILELNDSVGLITSNSQIMSELQRYIIVLFQNYVQFGDGDPKKIVYIFKICYREDNASIILDNIIEEAVNNCAQSAMLNISSGALLRANKILLYISWMSSQQQVEYSPGIMPKLSNKDSWLEEVLLKIGNHEKIVQISRPDWLQQQIDHMMKLNRRSVSQIDAVAYIDDVCRILQEIKPVFTKDVSNLSKLRSELINKACVDMVNLIKIAIEKCKKFDGVEYSNLLTLCTELNIKVELVESIRQSIKEYIKSGNNKEDIIRSLNTLKIINEYDKQESLLSSTIVDEVDTYYTTIITEVLKYFILNSKNEVSEATASQCIAVLSCLQHIDIKDVPDKDRVRNIDVLTKLHYRYPELDSELNISSSKKLGMPKSVLDKLNFVKDQPLLELCQMVVTSASSIRHSPSVVMDDLEK